VSAALDVGAHIGSHTVGLSRAVGPTGRVLAFEPQQSLYDVLEANSALSGLNNIDSRKVAVGACSGGPPVPLVPIPIIDVRARVDMPHWRNFTGPSGSNPDESAGRNYGAVSIVDIQRMLAQDLNVEGTASGGTDHDVSFGTRSSQREDLRDHHDDDPALPRAKGSPSQADQADGEAPQPATGSATGRSSSSGRSSGSPAPGSKTESDWVDWVEQVCLDDLQVDSESGSTSGRASLPSLSTCPRLIKIECEGMEAEVRSKTQTRVA
jgi:FkbM family methyltransferase